MKRHALSAITAGVAMLVCCPAFADVTGRASVIDGDTLEIQGERIRIWGVDAPEGAQLCTSAAQEQYRCGQRAALELSQWINGRTVTCDQIDTDRYGRSVSRCRTAGQDVGAWLVGRGWATDYRQYSGGAYASQEAAARSAKVGMWAGRFTEPSAWRREGRAAATATRPTTSGSQRSPSGCVVKGNINAKGERIYHAPGMRSYAETQINTGRGERWFCSEAEARNAGWRAPRG